VTLFDEADEAAGTEDADSVEDAERGEGVVRVRMTVAYDGSGFHGFAPQPGGIRTVGGVIAGALERVLRLPGPPALICAGRTDAGVHAWGQVAHVDLPAEGRAGPLDLGDLHRRLIKLLAPAVVVREIGVAPPGWDARRSARSRSYRYQVLNRRVPDPFLHGRVWLVETPIDLPSMRLACDPLIGEHDFASFCRKDKDGSLVRRVLDAGWVDLGDGLLRFDVTATSFCQQMVRAIVGTLVDVGIGRRRAGEVAGILRAADRSAAGSVAPPNGLCLWEVCYPNG
jgi:tRNA pseudouridine38-40 synthase